MPYTTTAAAAISSGHVHLLQPLHHPPTTTKNNRRRRLMSSSSSSSSFPLETKRTSGRSQKRIERRKHWKHVKQQYSLRHSSKHKHGGKGAVASDTTTDDNDSDDDKQDTRTWRTILFPPAYVDPNAPPPPQWPPLSQPHIWRDGLQEAWGLYKDTWEGFFSTGKPNQGDNHHHHHPEVHHKHDSSTTAAAVEQVAENARRNLEVAKTEGERLVTAAKEHTGIYTVEDLKLVAREFMMTATQMLTEFMKEYRKGRDDEVDKMLHEYFQQQEDGDKDDTDTSKEQPEKKRRRSKRRIPSLGN